MKRIITALLLFSSFLTFGQIDTIRIKTGLLIDTIPMSDRIDTKFNIVDTTGKWVYTVIKINDSTIRVGKGGSFTDLLIRGNGAGGSGGGTIAQFLASAFDTSHIYRNWGWLGIGDTAKSKLTITSKAIGVLPSGSTISDTSAIVIENTTPATNGNQQQSPEIYLDGQGFPTTLGVSKRVRFGIRVVPVQGTTIPSGSLIIRTAINATNSNSLNDIFILGNGGTLTLAGSAADLNCRNISLTGNISAVSAVLNGVSSLGFTNTTTVVKGWNLVTTATSAGVPVRYGLGYFSQGHVWNTTTAADNFATFGWYVKPVSGAIPTATYVLQGGVNNVGTSSDILSVTEGGALILKEYTVATLPTIASGTAYATVSDATSPTYLGTLTGGGAVKCPVFYNGSAWVSH